NNGLTIAGSLASKETSMTTLATITSGGTTYYAIAPVTLLTDANYPLTFANGTLAVTKRAVTVTGDAKSKTYGAADQALTYQVTAGSLANNDTFTGALTRAAGEGTGTYAILQGTLALNASYQLSFAGANLPITMRAVTVTADAKSKVYGEADPTLTYQVTSGTLVGS